MQYSDCFALCYTFLLSHESSHPPSKEILGCHFARVVNKEGQRHINAHRQFLLEDAMVAFQCTISDVSKLLQVYFLGESAQ